MLTHSFCHLPRITPRREQALWKAGITSWDKLALGNIPGAGVTTDDSHMKALAESRRALSGKDYRFFGTSLPPKDLWRLFGEFQDRVTYLDIETTGMGKGYDHITTVVAYDGQEVRHFVHGRNLDEFPEYILRAEIMVTFNGKCFDLPFINRQFGLSLSPVHLDLRYILRGIGLTGGLKKCEVALGLDRKDLANVDGYFAVLLWQEYLRRKNARALETLLAYNFLDVINLEVLMITAYNRYLALLPFDAGPELPMPRWQPENPFVADVELIDTLRTTMLQHAW